MAPRSAASLGIATGLFFLSSETASRLVKWTFFDIW